MAMKTLPPEPAAASKAAAAPEAPKPSATPFESVALLLQGGGALGAYQAGVYEALQEAGVEPTWIAGISIGAINSAIIAGNPPERRIPRLREFWELVSDGQNDAWGGGWAWMVQNAAMRGWANQLAAGQTMVTGVPG